jgi:DNA (cytosine-5)-methyltransferase 1
MAWSADEELQIPAYEGRNNIFRDVYGRMFWDRPAPTITTRFNSFSNGRFGHPEENRAISIREGARLQTFPMEYSFLGPSLNSLARQIGNAVPPELARRIGVHLRSVFTNHG